MVLMLHLFETVLFRSFQEVKGSEYHLINFQQSILHHDVNHVMICNIDSKYYQYIINGYMKLLKLLFP